MSGDNTYVDDLMKLAFIDLYLNSEFYTKRPSFVKVMNSHSGVSNNVDTLLGLSVLHGALGAFTSSVLVLPELNLILVKPKWSSQKKKHSIFIVHLNGQALCVYLLYLQFVCFLSSAVTKVMMPC